MQTFSKSMTNQTQQFLSEKLSHHLSSLAPGFEGHWRWYRHVQNESKIVACLADNENTDGVYVEICPAWQAEDVLRNWTVITVKVPTLIMSWHEKISWLLVSYPDTAYQKIEEYFWSILK